ncbi:DNA polymerase IV [Corynebacterium yudongzhengii]|uniref:DNA polymerase IV n=1 Tax=Corynebacterium yudongzhengii TaxID=2080740 RepID=A0A2U1T6F1_9CORY|nr:DNA polymerase IV [Corynebacterium yudongzhengii]AWB81584.1 DNA polymerase IV [Corynebacterium yudongzhengii]PWC01569.1 DNA polymerase IV [Corynebacterium yudongzhengii]
MQRWVLHIDMDAFFASVEQLTRPTLRGRPVLVAGVSGRGVVAGASYEARVFGAHSAMPTARAARLVGNRAVLVSPRKEVYAVASRRVFEVVHRHVDTVEQLSIDEAFMEPAELQGAGVEDVEKWAQRLRADIRAETGLAASIGAGSGKQFAKIASDEAKPDGVFLIPEDNQLEILHPMPVKKLWGVGPVTNTKLAGMGVRTIGELAKLTTREVEISLGTTTGLFLRDLARGIDERPVAPRAEAKQTSAEHTYPEDLTTRAEVDAALIRSAQDAHRRLRRDGRGARTVTVKLRMADFHIESRSATLPYATDDLDTLQAVAFRVVRYPEEVGPIRLVGVGYSGLEATRQDVLFPELELQAIPPTTTEDSDYETGVSDGVDAAQEAVRFDPSDLKPASTDTWRATQDVYHPDYGHGWVQGSGHGRVSVRFETRETGPGKTHTFDAEDPQLRPADPLDSLAWQDWLKNRADPAD